MSSELVSKQNPLEFGCLRRQLQLQGQGGVKKGTIEGWVISVWVIDVCNGYSIDADFIYNKLSLRVSFSGIRREGNGFVY